MSSKVKKAHGDTLINVIATCLHCEEIMDLAESQTFENLHEGGYLFSKIFEGDRFGCNDLEKTVKCPECDGLVRITNIFW